MEISAIVKEGTINDGKTYLLEGLQGSKLLALVAWAVVIPVNYTVIVRVLNILVWLFNPVIPRRQCKKFHTP